MAGGYGNEIAGGARQVPITGQGVSGINCIYSFTHVIFPVVCPYLTMLPILAAAQAMVIMFHQ